MNPVGLMAMLAWTGGGLSIGKSYCDPLEGIDIEAEAKLVMKKKSSLTASQRKAVMCRYSCVNRPRHQ